MTKREEVSRLLIKKCKALDSNMNVTLVSIPINEYELRQLRKDKKIEVKNIHVDGTTRLLCSTDRFNLLKRNYDTETGLKNLHSTEKLYSTSVTL